MSARARLEAVVFDAGGTLVRLDFEWMSAWLAERGHAVDAATLRRAEVEGRRRYDASAAFDAHRADDVADPPLGRAGDTRAYFGGTLAAAGVGPALVEQALAAFLARQEREGIWTRAAEGARETIDALPALGLRAACVSNSDGRAEWHLEHCGVRAGLEFVVDSKLVGVEKPDARIFAIALERLGVPAARALYVGDIRCVDEVGSRAAGMHFVLIDPLGDYGAPGGPAIAAIGALPAWISEHFDVSGALAAAQPDHTHPSHPARRP